MAIELGRIHALFRYPVKSMAGEERHTAGLGWYGIEGDRRFAFRRMNVHSDFPWLSASRLPELLLYKPMQTSPVTVCTPEGRELELHSEELRAEISNRHGAEVQLMQLKQGIFDETSISLISLATIRRIEQESGRSLEILRFRPNIVIETLNDEPFGEDHWVGQRIIFGTDTDVPSVHVVMKDLRCVMINLDPATAQADRRVMESTTRLNQNYAGVYCTVTNTGVLEVGQKLSLG
jgi:hypothetical protein